MSFNIRFGTANDGKNHWHHRRPLVIKTLQQHTCDIFGLQESLYFQLDEILREFPQYRLIGVGRDDGDRAGEFASILYNSNRFIVKESATFWLSETPDIPGSRHWGNRSPRICTWVHLKDKVQKKECYVYNVHLDHRSQFSRLKSCDLLFDRICQHKSPAPVIITGDFNVIESNEIIKFLKGIRPLKTGKTNKFPMTDAYRLIHPKALGGTLHLFRGIRFGPRIDFVFTTQDIEVSSAAILRTHFENKYPSDHFPLIAHLKI
jgi:endonuclease/exonuclease/phosphatase family metal-dependent hydrolase